MHVQTNSGTSGRCVTFCPSCSCHARVVASLHAIQMRSDRISQIVIDIYLSLDVIDVDLIAFMGRFDHDLTSRLETYG